MSCAARQVNSRRRPPLPTPLPVGRMSSSDGDNRRRVTSQSPREKANYTADKLVDESKLDATHITSGITSNQVTEYLNRHPEYLDSYVLKHVTPSAIGQWHWQCQQSQVANRVQGKDKDSQSANRVSAASPDSGSHRLREPSGNHIERESPSSWKFCVHNEKRRLLKDLSRGIHKNPNKARVLSELAQCVSSAIESDGFNLYLIDEGSKELYFCEPNSDNVAETSTCSRSVGVGSTLAAYVAHTKAILRLEQPLQDERFPEGIAVGKEQIKSALCLPIIQGNEEVVGVVEFYRLQGVGRQFTAEDQEVSESFFTWSILICSYLEMFSSMTKQRKLNDFILAVTRSIFQDIVSMDTVIMKIMNFAQRLTNSDRASLFLVDHRTKELFARIFDVGDGHGLQKLDGKMYKEIRFPMDKGVAGHVASTGAILNIPDAYKDDRFNRNIDLQTGYKTKTLLCMPIYIRGSIIGVVQMVNKLSGVFTKSDEEAFEVFAVYCGLALHHAKLYDKIRRSEQKYRVALEVLTYHSQVTDDEFSRYMVKDVPREIPSLASYTFSPWSVPDDNKPVYVLYMFRKLFSRLSSIHYEERFDLDYLMRFTLTVRKNYRNVPYHNWSHAFSVAHAMYTVVCTTHNSFTPLEALSLFVACLCHDLDHRGKTNSFMVKSASPLAAIYSTSTMEHHHFNQTVAILQHEGHNIFNHLTSEEYKEVLSSIRHCILATDLALFFGNKATLKEISEKKEFDWKNTNHRNLLQAIAMTGSDLCASSKPWSVQLATVRVIFEEFYAQGDEEKSRGTQPIAMMDREKSDQLPQSQVGFIVGICLPCYELLAQVLPETKPMVEGASANLKKWTELANKQEQEAEARNESET